MKHVNRNESDMWTGRCFKGMLTILVTFSLFLIIATLPAMAQERLSVKSKTANIRSGPGTKYDVVWQIEKYHPVLVQEKKGKWYKFKDFEGDVAWVFGSLLDKTETVISAKEKCNVRKGPATGFDIVFTVEKGVPFKVLKKKDNWINIEHADGDTGWIHSSLVW